MLTKKDIQLQQESLIDLSEMVEAYEEMAAMKMKEVRDGVVKGRSFLEGLSEVFSEIRAEKGKEVQLNMAHNGKTVVVLITSNTGLFGEIIQKTLGEFRSFLEKEKAEIVVLGRTGRDWLERTFKGKKYQYFDIYDDRVEEKMLKELMEYLVKFEKVVLFHGKFLSLVEQEAVETDLIGKLGELKKDQPTIKYLYEPSLNEVVRVFKEEILYSMFEQVLWESHLAKFASRIVHLDKALDNIDQRVGQLKQVGRNLENQMTNKKQLNRLAALRRFPAQFS